MRDAIVARKYAVALFQAASHAGEIDRVASDLSSLTELNAADPRFLRHLASPQVTTRSKKELLDTILKGRASEITRRFLLLVLDKKRLDSLFEIFEKFHELVLKHRGIVKAEVKTAVPLEPAHVDRIRSRLSRMTGKTIDLESRVDPEILGGVIVAFENQIIDRSVRRGLDDLRDTLLKVRVL
jgi:F-type H+-transporting ATPase subunit delta